MKVFLAIRSPDCVVSTTLKDISAATGVRASTIRTAFSRSQSVIERNGWVIAMSALLRIKGRGRSFR
jgi:hypothetical protein